MITTELTTAACPVCGELNCGFPILNSPFKWGVFDERGIRHIAPCDEKDHFVWSPHTLSLDCVCNPYLSNFGYTDDKDSLDMVMVVHCASRCYTGY